MNNTDIELHKYLQLTIDNENRLVHLSTLLINQHSPEVKELKRKELYSCSNAEVLVDKPLGELLFSFINASFDTLEGFKLFLNVWGVSGLLKLKSTTNNLDFNYEPYNKITIDKLLLSLYNHSKQPLIDAQKKFRNTVDFCVNVANKSYLKDLTPLQRYYVGNLKKCIPNLDEYKCSMYLTYDVIRNYTNLSLTKEMEPEYDYVSEFYYPSEDDYSIEELCEFVKTDTFKIKHTYYTQNIIDFVYIDFFNLLTNFSINKCANCNKYFVPKNKINEIYCEDCRLTGYINKVKNNEFLKAYNTAYKTKHAQKKRKTTGKSTKLSNKYDLALKKWRKEAKLKLSLVQKDEISEEEFKNFLKSDLEV